MATSDGGLVTVAYGPSEVRTRLHGKDVAIEEDTLYPFRGSVRLTVHLRGIATFPIVLRIPSWASSASIKVNGSAAEAANDNFPTAFFPITRAWKEGDVVTIDLPTQPRVEHAFHDSVVMERGPLVFALPLNGKWTELKHYAEKSSDWEVQSSRPWNYALQVGDCDATVAEHPVSDTPFDAQHPAVSMQVRGKRLPAWTVEQNSSAAVPLSPVSSNGPWASLLLVPYGAAKVRITAFPFLDQPSRCAP
jgi:hypothetical protein